MVGRVLDIDSMVTEDQLATYLEGQIPIEFGLFGAYSSTIEYI